MSAGIGIYEPKYPISAIADEVAGMEENAKSLPGKNAVAIFADGSSHKASDGAGNTIDISDGIYNWQEFEQNVLEEKYRHIESFFGISEERGKNFLYHLLELIRNRNAGEKINFARYVYILSRLEPDKKASPEQKAAYKEFSLKMYQWYQGENAEADCRHLKTAMNLYAYLTREKEETKDADNGTKLCR